MAKEARTGYCNGSDMLVYVGGKAVGHVSGGQVDHIRLEAQDKMLGKLVRAQDDSTEGGKEAFPVDDEFLPGRLGDDLPPLGVFADEKEGRQPGSGFREEECGTLTYVRQRVAA